MRRCLFLALATLWACASSEVAGEGDAAVPDALVPDDGAGSDAPVDAPPDGAPDAMPQARTWRDDTAAELGAGASLERAVVEAPGVIAPEAYYTGGLLWRASNTGTFTDPVAMTWGQVTAFPATGKAAIARSTALAFGSDTPPSVGLTDPDTFSMWFEGEVYLEAGSYNFALFADDYGFLDLAPSPTGVFQRVAVATFPTEGTGSFTAPSTGWYPIRFAVSEGAGDAGVQLRAVGPGLPTLQPIPRHRLRARVSGVVGLFQSGFDDSRLLGDVDHTIDAVTPANTNWGDGNPGDLGMTSADDFSVRWTGQVRIDVAGDYTFRYASDDGQRLWIDGQRLLDAWDDQTHDQTTAPVTLGAGWHDLVVDQNERGGAAAAWLTVASGPELAGQPLPLDRLRPVEGRAERYETGVDRTDRAIPSSGQAPDSTVVLTAPAGATVTGVDVSYTFTHTYWGDLEIRLIAPNGATALLRDNVGGSTGGTLTERFTRADLNGAPVAGTWILRVNDTQASDAGTLQDFQVTVHHGAGEPPIATSAAVESQVRDLGDVAAITRVSWLERVPAGADIAVRLRTCATAAGCATEPWSPPITDPAGATPVVAPRRFAQYRVELTSNGDRGPVLDQITIEYTVNP